MTTPPTTDEAPPAAPTTWLEAALRHPGAVRTVKGAGAKIAYRRWGAGHADGCILVHGVAAHGRWWDHVAPTLAHGRDVVAVDLSGHGDSDRRPRYSREQWAAELVAVADQEGMRNPFIVGHSLGGMVALRAAALYPDRFGGIVAMESNVLEKRLPPDKDPAVILRRPLKVYASEQDAVDRWRPLPAEPVVDLVARHVAAHSVKEAHGGWSWKFDPEVFAEAVMLQEELAAVSVPVVLYRGENRSVPADRLQRMADLIGPGTRHLTLPGVGHNVMLADPRMVTIVLDTLISGWESARHLG